MAMMSSVCRASAFMSLRCWKTSQLCLGGVVPFARFATVTHAVDLFQHIQSNNEIFSQNEHQLRMVAQPDDVGTNIICTSDARIRHVKGSEKYLETRGIKLSTIRMMFDYLRNRVIPREDEFPFEYKDGPEKGTLLTLRRKFKDEIILVRVRAVDEERLREAQAGDENRSPEDLYWFRCLEHCFDAVDECNLSESMEYYACRGDEREGREIGCLNLTVYIHYGYHYTKRNKLDVFAFPDKIVVPETSLSDIWCNCLEAFDTYFKEREIHAGTSIAQKRECEEHHIKIEHVPKVFGRSDESEMKVTKHQADKGFGGFTSGSFSKPDNEVNSGRDIVRTLNDRTKLNP